MYFISSFEQLSFESNTTIINHGSTLNPVRVPTKEVGRLVVGVTFNEKIRSCSQIKNAEVRKLYLHLEL